MTNKSFKSIVSILLICVMVLSNLSILTHAQISDVTDDESNKYSNYIKSQNAENAANPIEISIFNYKGNDIDKVQIITECGDKKGRFLIPPQVGYIEWEVDISQTAYYLITIEYYALDNGSTPISKELYIDGKLPFKEANNINFLRNYEFSQKEKMVDANGNEIKRSLVEKKIWQKNTISDPFGFDGDYKFYLESGKHSIGLKGDVGNFAISSITLHGQKPLRTLKQILKDNKYDKTHNVFLEYQAEDYSRVSDAIIQPITDKTSPYTHPYNLKNIVFNTLGGENWSLAGHKVSWDVYADKAGIYNLRFRAKQSSNRGMIGYRRLYVNNEIPYQEAQAIPFEYSTKWSLIGSKQDLKIPLKQGKNTISLEVVLGENREYINELNNSILNLTECYRQLSNILGVSPDKYREYYFMDLVPDAILILRSESANLNALIEKMRKDTRQISEELVAVEKLASILDIISEDISKIPEFFNQFDAELTNTSIIVRNLKEIGVELDYLIIASDDKMSQINRVEANFFEKLAHQFNSFIQSFFSNYNLIYSSSNKKSIDVWITTGRDQADVATELIQTKFMPQKKINVNFKLASVDIMMPTIIAGNAPDVFLQVGAQQVIEIALRGGVYNLSNFKDCNEYIKDRFVKGSAEQYAYKGFQYGVPEQVTFPMMFCRNDILNEYNLSIPKTWDELFKILPILQKNKMSVGIALDINTYYMLLMQNNVDPYSDDLLKVNFGENKALDQFQRLTDFYNVYRVPLAFNPVNRFKSGEMPIVISDYTLYNSIEVFAPELKGLWKFAQVPGVKDNNGNINNIAPSTTAAGSFITEKSKNPEDAWEFIKWWNEGETQIEYTLKLENLLGRGGRNAPSTRYALEKMPWAKDDLNILKDQTEKLNYVPIVIGNYMVLRQFINAFRNSTILGKDPRETMLDYVGEINKEIELKAKEYASAEKK